MYFDFFYCIVVLASFFLQYIVKMNMLIDKRHEYFRHFSKFKYKNRPNGEPGAKFHINVYFQERSFFENLPPLKIRNL